jgi:aspartate/methionine/tyrosine aminotransferase
VAVVPGTAFGAGGAGLVRVSLAAAREAIEEGLARLAAALAEPVESRRAAGAPAAAKGS